MKNKHQINWADNPMIYPNEILDPLGENIKMAATMIATEAKDFSLPEMLDVIRGVMHEIKNHYNALDSGNKEVLDVRPYYTGDENTLKFELSTYRRPDVYFVEESANYYAGMRDHKIGYVGTPI